MRHIDSDPSSPSSPTAHARPEDVEARMKIEIREIGIPPRPSILARIEQETAKEEPDFIQLARILSQDVALSASLIKVANSPYFSFGKTVPTVQEALLVLGLKLVLKTVAGLALQQVFKHVPNMEQFWDASATNAQTANWLARKIGQKRGIRPEDAYTFSLFRDCGIPVLLIPFPDYQTTLDAANLEPSLSFTAVEDQAMGINHALVGAEMAETWLLPEDICVAIRHHHDIQAFAPATPEISERSQALIAISHVAEYLVQQKTGWAQSGEWEKLGPACRVALGIDDDELAALAEAYMAK
jgi:HD-like signal output (HDOD) protein